MKAHAHLPHPPCLSSLVTGVLLDSLLQNQKRDSDAEADGCILQSERTRPGATSAPGAISLLIVAMQAAIYLIFIVKESALRTPLHNLTWTKGTSLMPA